MTALVFDLEGNGLLRSVSKLWCLVVIDAETGEVTRYNDQGTGRESIAIGRARMLEVARSGGLVVAHNGVGYDFPALQKLFGDEFPEASRMDTMVLARLFNPERREGHSIESYGAAAGIIKDTGADDFTQWSQRLEDRCEADARTTLWLWRELTRRGILGWGVPVPALTSGLALAPWLELRFAEIIAMQMENGVSFDERLAVETAAECQEELTRLQVELQRAFPVRYVADKHKGSAVFVPKKDNKAAGYVAGAAFSRVKLEEFNPGSGQQIADRFIRKYGWKPTKFTDGGIPATDEEVLKNLDYPEAKLLARFMRVDKIWKQIAAPPKGDSPGGWLHCVNPETGRIHGYVNSCGAVTTRCTHSRPNTANVDKKDKRLRAMWKPRPGWYFLGGDGSSLELCMLSHYLARYDGGDYGRRVTEGKKEDGTDAHTLTIRLLGMIKRDNGKRVIYAMIYGAGDAKLGLIIVEDALEHDKYTVEAMPHLFKPSQRHGVKKRSMSDLGAEARGKLETGIKGLGELKRAVAQKVRESGHVRSLDGRRLRIRSAHSALNTLLQGGGAVVMKLAVVLFHRRLMADGLKHGTDFGYCLNVHDEAQIEFPSREIAEKYGPVFTACITEAGKVLNVQCPLSGDFAVGATWADTH